MPELPEVTVISEDVRSLAGGREVLRAGVFRPDVTNVEPEEFTRRLVGRTLRGTGRRGKITLLDFGDVVGVVHLVISGRVLRLPAWTEPDRINTAVLEFEGGLVLAFTRLWLGYFHLYEPGTVDEHPLISRLGPDPFSDDFTPEYLANAFERKASVKGLLLDQSVVAGLGNIYVDEVLFAAGVHPTRKANTLGPGRDNRHPRRDARHPRPGHRAAGYDLRLLPRRVRRERRVPAPAQGLHPRGRALPGLRHEIVKSRVAGRRTYTCPACQEAS